MKLFQIRLTTLLTSFTFCMASALAQSSFQLFFPQIGDGNFGSLIFKTSFILFNTTNSNATGRIELFSSDGGKMNFKIQDQLASSFSLSVPSGGVLKLQSSGEGDGKVGWARVTSDQPIEGAATFALFDASGQFLSEVGVSNNQPLGGFSLFVDTIGEINTGIALANPNEQAVKARLFLIDKLGKQVAAGEIDLAALTHTSKFITEIFTTVSTIGEFEGTLRVIGTKKLVALTLRVRGVNFTSLPVVP